MQALMNLLVVGGLVCLFGVVAIAGTLAAMHEPARVRYQKRPRLDHDCNVMGGAADREERLIGLHVADRELKAAAARVTAC